MDNQMIGRLLDGRYELLEVIGTGGMAMVYKAQDRRLNRSVAVKILKSELAEDAEFRRRFRDESQAVAMLSHPNIVSVYDVSRGETEYIVMELIDGITLKQYMERRGKLNWRESLHFITQIMQGLGHAHSRGIIHRDIKPQNVMILRDGSVRIADFGIARLESAAQQTMTQQALGSVHYISPEQAKGDRTDARSDIYSSGVVLYEMLTNRLPFEGDSAVSVALQHVSSVPLSPCEIDPTVPEALEKICMKAMASDINKRYASADAMIADLEEFRKNPDTSLDFTIEELHEKPSSDPTMPLPAVREVAARLVKNREEHEDDEVIEAEYEELSQPILPKALIIAAIIAVCATAIFGLWQLILGSFDNTEPVQTDFVVPNLLGMTIDEAGKDERVKDIFTITEIGRRPSTEYEAGQIIEQSPVAGKTVRDKREITVFVSTGVKSDVMPDVVNKEHRAAALQLKALNLDLVINEAVEEYNDSISAGYVISSNPVAGETLQEGDVVMLVISKGPETPTSTVTTLTDIPLPQAQQIVSDLGLVCLIDYANDDNVPIDYVISQSIPPTTQVEQGSSIKLIVSLGPAQPETEDPSGADQPTGETTEPGAEPSEDGTGGGM